MIKVTNYNGYRLKTEQTREFEEFEEAEEYAKEIFKAFKEELDHDDFDVTIKTENIEIVYEPETRRLSRLQRKLLDVIYDTIEVENLKDFLTEIEEELFEIKHSLIRFK
jgi:hypothetical protein